MSSSTPTPSSTGPKPSMGLLVRLIRGSRESNPPDHRRPTEGWELLNLRMKDSTAGLPSFNLGPLEFTVRLEVIVGGSGSLTNIRHSSGNENAEGTDIAPVVVVERWKISVGNNGDDTGTLAANRVFVHSLLGYLKVSEFYSDVVQRTDVRCRIQPDVRPGSAPPTAETMWEQRHFTVAAEDGGLSAVCQYNKLWRRELAELDRPVVSLKATPSSSPSQGGGAALLGYDETSVGDVSIGQGSAGSSDQKLVQPNSALSSGDKLPPTNPGYPTVVVPPIKGFGERSNSSTAGSGRGSYHSTQSPPLGPQGDPTQPVPNIGSLGSGKQSLYTTPPFHPSSLNAHTGLMGSSPGNAVFDPMSLPGPLTIGSNPQHQGGLCGSAPSGSHPLHALAQAEMPQMVALVQEGDGSGQTVVRSPIMAQRGRSFGDNFAAMMNTDDANFPLLEEEEEREEQQQNHSSGGRGSALAGTEGGEFGDVTDFMATAAECCLNTPMINVHEYLQSVLGES